MRIALLLLGLALSSSFVATPTADVAAQGAGKISVTPRVIDVAAEPRDILNETITIENHTNARIRVFATVNEIDLDAGGDIIEFTGPTMVDRPSAITSWLEISRGQITLDPGEVREVPLTIRMNPNAVAGEYHALIGFGVGMNRIIAEKQVEAGVTPSVVVTVRVADTTVERMNLKRFFIDRFVLSNENEAVQYTLTNDGDTKVQPTGEIIIYDTNGREVSFLEANPDNLVLEPGEERLVTQPLSIDGMMGRHKAFLNIAYGAQTANVYDTVFFYAVPWKKLLIMFGIVLVVAVFLTLYLYYRYEIRDADEDDEEDEEGVHKVKVKVRDKSSRQVTDETDVILKHDP